MNILILEPYFTGSHKAWAEGYAHYSGHEVRILSLHGNFWKWRMHGGAVSLARKFYELDFTPDLLLATDMLDLTIFLSLTREKTSSLPVALYFHENQLTYPWSPSDRDVAKNRDKHYGFINYASALAADAVFFNSQYHLQAFLSELPGFLRHFPDQQELETVEQIEAKSRVLPLGLDLERLDAAHLASEDGCRPLILWNHRWEYDKNPGEFFHALEILADKELDFEVAIVGECFSRRPEAFLSAKEKLGDRIVQFGYVKAFADYAAWLWKADILPVTSYQDFFGTSLVEAIYCNCYPILPYRLAYPELVPSELHPRHFYNDFEELVHKLETAIRNCKGLQKQTLRWLAKQFKWQMLTPRYDEQFERLL